MTPAELYARTPETISRDISMLLDGSSYHHLMEFSPCGDIPREIQENNERVEIRYYKDFCYDGRRVWVLASIWFDGAPVMIIQNAGREGRDHYARFITDQAAYRSMLEYLYSLVLAALELDDDLVAADADIEDLTTFYGASLDDVFEQYPR